MMADGILWHFSNVDMTTRLTIATEKDQAPLKEHTRSHAACAPPCGGQLVPTYPPSPHRLAASPSRCRCRLRPQRRRCEARLRAWRQWSKGPAHTTHGGRLFGAPEGPRRVGSPAGTCGCQWQAEGTGMMQFIGYDIRQATHYMMQIRRAACQWQRCATRSMLVQTNPLEGWTSVLAAVSVQVASCNSGIVQHAYSVTRVISLNDSWRGSCGVPREGVCTRSAISPRLCLRHPLAWAAYPCGLIRVVTQCANGRQFIYKRT
jgi:hypothetical protein